MSYRNRGARRMRPLAAISLVLILSGPTHGQEMNGVPKPSTIVAAPTIQAIEPARPDAGASERAARAPDQPSKAGKKPCRKPSGELVSERSAFDDELSSFDKR